MSKENILMKTRLKRVVTADQAVPTTLPREIIVLRRRPTQLPVALPLSQQPEQTKGAEPCLGSFGVLVVLADSTTSRRSLETLSQFAPIWQGRDVVFLSAASRRVATQASALFPKLFYNVGEPLALATLWRLLPWRAVVVIRAGKVCCWKPASHGAGSSNVQHLMNK
jgi:hypothetical protein